MTLRETLDRSSRIAFFGGAGVSTESGIPDFRSGDGVFRAMQAYGHSPEYLLSIDCLEEDPALFFDYYRKFLLYPNARPNAAHRALAYLEQAGRLTGLATQNIDGLHQMAGSREVYELHGSVHRNHCVACGRRYTLEEMPKISQGVPRCTCGGMIRPDVTLYGEMLDERVMQKARAAIRKADTLIIGGTSLAVWPAAGLIHDFHGDTLIVMNKSATTADGLASMLVREGIAESFAAAYPELS